MIATILSILTALAPAVLPLLAIIAERMAARGAAAAERKEVLKDAETTVERGLERRDPGDVTLGFDRVNRV